MRWTCKTNGMDLKERYNGYRILISDVEKVELRYQIHRRIRFFQNLSLTCWLDPRKEQEGTIEELYHQERLCFVSLWLSKLELQA
jgi:hypothetical protein